jgi:hypothetical protein
MREIGDHAFLIFYTGTTVIAVLVMDRRLLNETDDGPSLARGVLCGIGHRWRDVPHQGFLGSVGLIAIVDFS